MQHNCKTVFTLRLKLMLIRGIATGGISIGAYRNFSKGAKRLRPCNETPQWGEEWEASIPLPSPLRGLEERREIF